MSRRLTWVLLVALLLAPILGSVTVATPAFAQDDEVTAEIDETVPEASPVAEETPTEEPTGEPTETPTETATPAGTPTETPTEEPTAEPTEPPAATPAETPTEEPVVEATDLTELSDIVITVKCTTAPETVRVTNNGPTNIELTAFESLVDQIVDEPFALSRTLRAGNTAIFQSGPGAQYGTVLTTEELYTNDKYELDGVKLTTSLGEVIQACDPAPAEPIETELSDIVITVSCMTSPETVRVTNTGTANIQLTAFETLTDQLPDEPFALTRTLRAGNTAIFQSGRGAQYGTVLTSRYLFTNTKYEQDGVKLTTSIGEVTKACDPKPDPVDQVAENPGKLSDLKITLSCRGYAETIRVTNTGSGYILLKALATYYDPLPDEPYRLDRVLRPGKTAIYQAGTGAQYGTVLTKDYIFTNSAWDDDGVRISTSAGKAYQACEAQPVPPEHWVEVDLSSQYLWAWEGNKVVNQTYVSTGKAGWETPTGTFYVLTKYRYDDMAGNVGGESWYVPAVPFTMYFTNWGHALHGAYWHNDFGTPRSHGCVNLPLPFAEWLFYWLPYGGRVVIHW